MPTIEEQILTRLDFLESLFVGKFKVWVPKEMLIRLTGLKGGTINTYVSEGKIKKAGNLYSYQSYLEYIESHDRREAK